MKKVVLFDFDGPINDTFAIALAAARTMTPDLDADVYRGMFRGNIFAHAGSGAGLVASGPPREDDPFFRAYVPPMLANPPVPGIPEAIATLAEHYRMLIVSSTVSAPIDRYLVAHDLRRHFDAVWGGDVNRSKVVKIGHALQYYQVKPELCVFVTDTVGDVLEARHHNVRSVAVSWGYHPSEMLMEAAPASLVENPLELVDAVHSLLA